MEVAFSMKAEAEIRSEIDALTQIIVAKFRAKSGGQFELGARTALEWLIGEKDAVSALSHRVDEWIASGRFGKFDLD